MPTTNCITDIGNTCLGALCPARFEPVSIDFQFRDFPFKSLPWNPKLGRGTGWTRDPSFALRESRFDRFPLRLQAPVFGFQ